MAIALHDEAGEALPMAASGAGATVIDRSQARYMLQFSLVFPLR
jgi:hypothetical protein